jgi:hypothetical protein
VGHIEKPLLIFAHLAVFLINNIYINGIFFPSAEEQNYTTTEWEGLAIQKFHHYYLPV